MTELLPKRDSAIWSVAISVAFTLAFSGFSNAFSAEAPLWQLGIPTFSGQKPEEKAAEGPSFQMPSPGEVIAEEAAESKGKFDLPANIQPVAYQLIDSDYSGASSPTAESIPLPTADSSFVVPDLPPGTEISLPVAPADPSSPIGLAIAAGANAETAPLEDETVSWYQVPWTWVTRGWDNHAELGLDGSSGNSRTLAFQMGLEMKRKTDRYTLGMDFDYRKATATGLTTEDNGRFNLDYDRMFEESKWSAFGKFGAEWDQFKAFDSRLNLNSGIGYHFVRSDDASLSTKFGAGASKEIGAPDDAWKAEAVFGAEGEYQLNRYNKMKAKVDFFPAWEDFSDYRLVSDVAWEILLDDTDNLSLKLALTDRYDSTPQGAKPNDVYYSLLLLVKF